MQCVTGQWRAFLHKCAHVHTSPTPRHHRVQSALQPHCDPNDLTPLRRVATRRRCCVGVACVFAGSNPSRALSRQRLEPAVVSSCSYPSLSSGGSSDNSRTSTARVTDLNSARRALSVPAPVRFTGLGEKRACHGSQPLDFRAWYIWDVRRDTVVLPPLMARPHYPSRTLRCGCRKNVERMGTERHPRSTVMTAGGAHGVRAGQD